MNVESFFKRLQESNAATKKRWTIGLSVVAMLIVITIWLSFFNPVRPESGAPQIENEPEYFSFMQTIRNGIAVMSEAILNVLRGIGEGLGSGRTYHVLP